MRGSIRFLLENSLFMILGAVAALIWANIDNQGYQHFVHLELFHTSWIGHPHGADRLVTLGFVVNEVLMALFFAIAGKEVWEATLPGGPLNNPRQAASPLIATLGGMTGPALVYLGGIALFGQFGELSNGWAVPTATDIAFSYMVARVVFGPAHPAIPFLLLLAIADDALGLVIIAVFYPQGPVEPVWMLLPVAAIVVGLVFRRLRVISFWPYLLIAGALSWYGFHRANLHPALGLLPIIPVMPHGHLDRGLFHWEALKRDDTLSAFEHWWKNPVEVILGLFGLLNAGVALTALGPVTGVVAAALIVGKPLGIWVFAYLGTKIGFPLPPGMRRRELLVVGCTAGIGFTVAIFVAGVAFPRGEIQDAAKIGALASFGAAVVALVIGRLLKLERMRTPTMPPGPMTPPPFGEH